MGEKKGRKRNNIKKVRVAEKRKNKGEKERKIGFRRGEEIYRKGTGDLFAASAGNDNNNWLKNPARG